ncbi:hypothetical protein NITHO_3940006 [Nitrolancea hollandica Lb]|uniref:Uncharacterized protein n=1 Tax=Nitrolancea hollandica Lb TaxID=1129897 RepID=I4EJC1_9BACT|nr:hypothetical protein NITHO_3940006 [Nitrolancea hollandica Lb]
MVCGCVRRATCAASIMHLGWLVPFVLIGLRDVL